MTKQPATEQRLVTVLADSGAAHSIVSDPSLVTNIKPSKVKTILDAGFEHHGIPHTVQGCGTITLRLRDCQNNIMIISMPTLIVPIYTDL